jgi:hypothetical protein
VNPEQYNPEWVPMIIVSPYARAGYTDSRAATFVSMLAFVEHTFGLAPLHPCATVGVGDRNCTDDENAYDYSNAFNFTQSPLAGSPRFEPPYRPVSGPGWQPIRRRATKPPDLRSRHERTPAAPAKVPSS